jgi:REP element-mobilizing transposase RayT
LASAATFDAIADAFDHYARNQPIWPHLILAMPDHLHALLSFPASVRMDKAPRDWKRFIAKRCGVTWPDGFFDHRLRTDESFDEKVHYIRQNPVRAGLVEQASSWPWAWSPSGVAPAR